MYAGGRAIDTPSTPSRSPTFDVDDEGIGWIVFDDPDRKVDVLTEPVMRTLAAAVDEADEAARAGRLRALVFRSAKEGSFIAGADVDAIADLEDPSEAEAGIRFGQEVYQAIEDLPAPTVAAIHGVCVGGGTELALACRHRVVSDDRRTKVGMPEVMLGILPAWGGTTRLPRLVGLRAALDLLLTGKTIDASKARRIGFAQEIFPADIFVERVRDFALRAPELPPGTSRRKRPLLGRLLEDTAPGRALVIATARRSVVAKTGGHYPAPLRILEVLRENLGRSVERSLAAEAKAAGELIVSSVCKNLIHVFRLRERARKQTGVGDAQVAPRTVREIGVLGAGVMGGGIAQLGASRGLEVRMKDIRHEAITGGLRHARALFDKAARRRRMSRREAEQGMERVSGGLEYHGFGALDLVVEAVVERMDVKRAALAELEEHVHPDCILATNTSSLSVDALADSLARPERFCGMHFFNPVHRMPLIEVVRGPRTDDETVATVYALVLALDKVPVVVRDGPGFVVNRVLGPYLNEAGWALGDGATIEEVDAAARAFGMPMGPLRLIDEVGIDVAGHAGEVLYEALGERLAPSPVLRAITTSGRLGRKGGSGFYRYEDEKEKGVDENVYAELGNAVPPRRGGKSERDVRPRLIGQMINEAARVLEEGVVESAAALDLAMIMGIGFPPFRGGLLRFADSLHSRGVLDRMKRLQDEFGDRFEPAPLLVELARSNRGFYEAFGS